LFSGLGLGSQDVIYMQAKTDKGRADRTDRDSAGDALRRKESRESFGWLYGFNGIERGARREYPSAAKTYQ
jgi:hypothetical protein